MFQSNGGDDITQPLFSRLRNPRQTHFLGQ